MLIAVTAVVPLKGQGFKSFKEKTNIVVIGQHENELSNTHNNSNGAIVYLDYAIYDNNNLMVSPFAIIGISGNNNVSGYEGRIKEYGVGISIGKYWPKVMETNEAWAGFNVGLRKNQDKGEVGNQFGTYNGEQNDLALTLGTGFNLWKKDIKSWFPRIQLQTNAIIPLSEKKDGFWNNAPIPDQTWNKTYIEVWLKQSLINISIGPYLTPKLAFQYSYAEGNKENSYGLGGEVSFHKPYRDDFLSFYCLYKISGKYENKISAGVIISLLSFF